MADDNILGPTAGIDAQGAADVLAQRIADIAQQAHPSDSGRVSWGTQGTPYLGERYSGPPTVPYPAAAPGPAIPASQTPLTDTLSQTEKDFPYSNNYASRVADPYFQASTAAPDNPLSPQYGSRSFGNYREALDLTHDLTTDLNDRYAQLGRVGDIGGKEYQSDRQGILVDAGLMNAPEVRRGGILANMREDWAEPYGKLNYGYAGMQLMQGVASDYAKNNAGQYVSPEQQETANAGLLPGIGAIAGTAIGSMIAPGVGSWVGGMIGGGLGSVGQSVVGANETREQATRETAERLAAALGQAADSVGTFKAQIEATGAPVAQLGQSLATVGGVGTYGSGSVAGVGALTNAFQDRAGEDFQAIAKYTSNPLLYGLGNRFSTGAAGSSDIVSLSYDAAENGDFGSLKTFQQAARDARGKNDPKSQELESALSEGRNTWWVRAASWIGGELSGNNPLTDMQSELDGRRKALGAGSDQDESTQNALINQFAALRSAGIVAEAGVKAAGTGIGLSVAQGGSAAQIGAASESLYTALGAARSATQGEIGQLQADLADPVRSAGRGEELKARIATAQAQLGGYDVAEAQQRRSVFQTGLSEEDANFSYFANRYTLSGRSAASLVDGYNRQEEFLSGVAADPRNPLSPAERSGLARSVDTMRYSVAQAVYGEENAGLSISRAGRDADVARETLLGSPQDAYAAQIRGLQSDRDQITQNNSELSRGNLTYSQRLGLTAQNVGLQADLDTGPERARLSAYDAEGGILSDTQAAGRAFLSRNVAINGSSAYASAFGDDQARINLALGGQSGSRPGTAAYARFGAQAAAGEAALLDDVTQSQVYRETPAQRIQDLTTQGAFQRSLEAPYMDGDPNNNPMTRGRALLGNLQSRLGGAEAALRSATDPLAREQNTRITEGLKDQIASVEADQRTGFLRYLPEFIAGSPGQGVLSGILPTPGQSAFYNGNPFVSGTFGRPSPGVTSDGSGHMATPGGTAGGYLAATGTETLLISVLKQLQASLAKSAQVGGRSPVIAGSPSAANFTSNTNMQVPGNGYAGANR